MLLGCQKRIRVCTLISSWMSLYNSPTLPTIYENKLGGIHCLDFNRLFYTISLELLELRHILINNSQLSPCWAPTVKRVQKKKKSKTKHVIRVHHIQKPASFQSLLFLIIRLFWRWNVFTKVRGICLPQSTLQSNFILFKRYIFLYML